MAELKIGGKTATAISIGGKNVSTFTIGGKTFSFSSPLFDESFRVGVDRVLYDGNGKELHTFPAIITRVRKTDNGILIAAGNKVYKEDGTEVAQTTPQSNVSVIYDFAWAPSTFGGAKELLLIYKDSGSSIHISSSAGTAVVGSISGIAHPEKLCSLIVGSFDTRWSAPKSGIIYAGNIGDNGSTATGYAAVPTTNLVKVNPDNGYGVYGITTTQAWSLATSSSGKETKDFPTGEVYTDCYWPDYSKNGFLGGSTGLGLLTSNVFGAMTITEQFKLSSGSTFLAVAGYSGVSQSALLYAKGGVLNYSTDGSDKKFGSVPATTSSKVSVLEGA